MKKYRIVFLDFDDIKNPLLGGGQARATLEVGKRLVEKGHFVEVITSRFPGSQDQYESGIYYHHIGLKSKNIRLNNLFYIFSLPFVLHKIQADIVVECFTAPMSTMFSPLFTKIPVVAIPTIFAANEFSRKYHLPFSLIEKVGCTFYKYFIAYTPDLAKKMKSYNQSVIYRVIPQGVDSGYFNIPKRKPKYILFLGRFDIDQKGIDLLLESYKRIAHNISWPLVLAGHGPDELKVRNLINNLGIKKSVKIIGPTYGEKKIKVLSEALFVVFPSRHDDMPLFSLEAIASGLPIVSFNLPEFSWLSQDLSFKAKPYNVDDFASKINEAANFNSLDKMQEKCREYAKQFSWDKVAVEYESFFAEIINKEKKK